MSIEDKIFEDLKAAMKAKDSLKVGTLRMVRAQFKDAQIAKREPLNDDEQLAVLGNAAKRRREALEMYKNSGRDDLIQKEQAELDIISVYLPKQLSREEIEKVLKDIIKKTDVSSMQDLGKVMGPAMQQLRGKADGKLVQQLVREILS
ncbi:MAG: GatB/YqeY domain-containing protein [Calditrichaeota bacterium]|nr:GatB/YqeY domain-containing protein [Calditrichota bacterium]